MFGNLDLWFFIKEFLITLEPPKDLFSLSLSCKTLRTRFSEECFHALLMHYVLRGKNEKIQSILTHNPRLLTRSVHGADYSGRTFYATPFEAMLWNMDILMGLNMLACIPCSSDGLKVLNNLSMQYKALEENHSCTDLVRLENHPSLYSSISVLKSLFTNQDAILFYGSECYYLHQKSDHFEALHFLQDPHSFLFDHYAMLQLKTIIQSLEVNTARHSTHAEHALIARTLNKRLSRNGLLYQYKGITYQSTHYDFAVIDAMKLCTQYKHTNAALAKALWEDAVAQKQKEWAVTIAHEFSEPDRRFCFESTELAKSTFRNYAKKRSLTFYDGHTKQIDALIFPLDEKYNSPGSVIVKGSRYPDPILSTVIFGSFARDRPAGWLRSQDFCETDCMASEAIFQVRKEGLGEIKSMLDSKIESMNAVLDSTTP